MHRNLGSATLTVALGAASIASAQVSNPQIYQAAFDGYVFGHAMVVSDITCNVRSGSVIRRSDGASI
jgi:hypothetical protein